MANRAMFLTQGTLVERLVYLQARFNVGASGAASGLQGSGVQSITRVTNSVGLYKVLLQDSYNKFLDLDYDVIEPAGTPVLASTALTVGQFYSITTLGGLTVAQWQTLGVPVGTVPAVGVGFVAAVAGTGSDPSSAVAPVTATAAPNSVAINLVGDPDTTMNLGSPSNAVQVVPHSGGYFFLQVRQGSTGAAVDIPSGSAVLLGFHLRNSKVKGKGE